MSEDAQLIFVVDIERRVKCRACETSCKIANSVDRGDIFYRKVRILEGGTYPNPTRQFVSMSCNHCTDPPCVRGCPTEARTRHPETGVLSLNQEICMGCQYCTWACPYGTISYNPAKGVVEQCDFQREASDPYAAKLCAKGYSAAQSLDDPDRVRVQVHLTEGIHPDVVGLQHGFGARELGRNARGRGVSDNTFLLARSERLSGMAIHKETRVRVSPVNF